jgi:hypothetical protein
MLSQGTRTRRDGINLPTQANIGGYTLSPGFYPLSGRSDQGSFFGFQYRSSGQAGLGALANNFLADPPQSVMTTAEPGQLCVVSVYNVRVCDDEQYEPTTMAFASEDNFQQTLIYSGRVGDRVRISYREFAGSLARPAFSNDVDYDLSVSNVIAYRGAQIRIVSADNSQITYEVLRNFNAARE